jgi:cytochrome P450
VSIPGPTDPIALVRFARAAARDPRAALRSLQDRYGDVVQIGSWPRPVIGLFGASANSLILSEHPEWFAWGNAMKALVPVDGPTALVVTDGPDHDRRRRLVQPGFHRRRIDEYVELMVEEAHHAIDGLERAGEVDVYEVFRVAIRRSVVLALFGPALRDRADVFGEMLQPAFDFVNRPPQLQVRSPLPGSGYRRARAARVAADRMIDDEIERRTSTVAGKDVLAALLTARDETGRGLTREEVRDQVVSLIAAGYDTTSATLGWTLDRVLREPAVRARLRDELMEVVGPAPLSFEHLRRLPYLHGVVQETLRLDPAGVVAPRTAVREFEFGGHRIRRGTLVLYSALLTGRDARIWRDPDIFRPERWIEGHPDHEVVAANAFVPFGGGARRCLGHAFASTELAVMTAEFVRRVDAELLTTEPPIGTGIASVSPRGGVRVRIRSVALAPAVG